MANDEDRLGPGPGGRAPDGAGFPTLDRLEAFLEDESGTDFLGSLYGADPAGLAAQAGRYRQLLDRFRAAFPGRERAVMASAPGRTELGGNHTDHENGRVLAAAVDLDVLGVAAPTDEPVVRLLSDDHPPIEVDLGRLEPLEAERNTSAALVRGVCASLGRRGHATGGMEACLSSTVPTGSGLSSSAAFELLVAMLLNLLHNRARLDPLALAQAGRAAEANYFGKPCGLMDQLTSAVGGLLAIDFARPERPAVRLVNFDLASSGHALVIVATGDSHAGLTGEYAAIREENLAVARYFREQVLRDVDRERFLGALTQLRPRVGDRALLRAMHFFDEDLRVGQQVAALEAGRFDTYLDLVRASGLSSWTLLQNSHAADRPSEQGIPLALALSARLLEGRGASRVHGGGFAGTIQAYVPTDLLPVYLRQMERVFGAGSCCTVRARPVGVVRLPVEAA